MRKIPTQHERLRQAILNVLRASTPFITAWEFDPYDDEADGEELHAALLDALGMTEDEWWAMREAFPPRLAPVTAVAEKALHREILDRIVIWRMGTHGGVEAGVAGQGHTIDREKLPAHLLGQYDRVVENALPLADSIMATIDRERGGLLSPDELADRMRHIAETDNAAGWASDVHASHELADEAMVGLLRAFGYGEAMDIYEQMEKWYA